MQLLAKWAGIALLALVFASPAYAADPFPNQPGVLSPAEIEDVTKAMKAMLGSEPALPLVASGRRSPEHMMPGYALFAAPPADFTDRIKIRRQIICNFFRPMGKWQCTKPQTEFRMTAQGIAHVFPYVVDTGPEDAQVAVNVADYMYSSCFAIQFKLLGGAKVVPSFNPFPITTVVSGAKGFTVRTGPDEGGDVYELEKTDRKADSCGFRIVSVRMNKTGLVLPENYAKEMAKQEKQAGKQLAAEQAAREEQVRGQSPQVTAGPVTTSRTNLAEKMMIGALSCGLAALVIPWIVLLFSRKWAAVTAGVLALTGTVLFVTTNQDAVRGNIRIDLIIIPALLLVAWVECAGLGVWARRQKPDPILGTPPGAISRIPLAIVGIVGSVVAALVVIFTAPMILSYLFG